MFFLLEYSSDETEDEEDDDEGAGSSSEEFTDSIEDDGVKLTAQSLANTQVNAQQEHTLQYSSLSPLGGNH